MINLKPCPICGREMTNTSIHLCGNTPTLIHTCINEITITIRADTKINVADKWNAFATVVQKQR